MSLSTSFQLELDFHSEPICWTYAVIRKARRRSILISVSKKNQIRITAPLGVSDQYLKTLIQKKADWIRKQIARNRESIGQWPERTFRAGETYYYLGDPYQLELIESTAVSAQLEGCSLKVPGFFEAQKIKQTMLAWYQEKADQVVRERVLVYQDLTRKPCLVKIKDQHTKWGSCTRTGRIYINWKLIMAPLPVIDYVVVHELCHLIHLNHSRNFWELVKSILPDYEDARAWLKENDGLLNW